MTRHTTEKTIALVGGGHAHVHVLKRFGEKPLPGARLVLVGDAVETPYSGMLPGLIAGHYAHEEAHIDLRPLAAFAGAELVHARAAGLDLKRRQVILDEGRPLDFDLLSIDIGSTARFTVPGAAEHATPVRPVRRFLTRLEDVTREAGERPLEIVVAGGGAGGVELLLSMRHRLSATPHAHRYTLVTAETLLAGHNARASRILRRILRERGVRVMEQTAVAEVEAGLLRTGDGEALSFDELLWTTGPGPHPWLAGTGLKLDDGFVAVETSLRSLSHPFVFAAGDTATVVEAPRPKAGVFAVRQGPPLAANLRRVARGHRPKPYRPQREFLSLISTGDEYAVASRGPFAAEGHWIWRWKDRIDRRWMRQYQELSGRDTGPSEPETRESAEDLSG